MTAVCDPGLGAIEKGGEQFRPVYTNLGLDLQVLVVPDPFMQSAEGTTCFGQPVVDFLVNPGIR